MINLNIWLDELLVDLRQDLGGLVVIQLPGVRGPVVDDEALDHALERFQQVSNSGLRCGSTWRHEKSPNEEKSNERKS